MMRYEQEFIDSLPHIHQSVATRMRDRGEDMNDVYSEAVYSLCKFLMDDKFRGGSSMKTLAISIALNKVKDYYRHYEVERRAIYKYTRENPLVTNDNRVESMLPAYLAELVHQLPSKQRRAILFYLYESENLSELARELSIIPETIRARFRRARKTISLLLADPPLLPKRTTDFEREALGVISNEKRESLKWLIKMHNAYICICRMNNGHPGIEQMIEDATEARNKIAESLICGRQINKLLDRMSDADTISYLAARER